MVGLASALGLFGAGTSAGLDTTPPTTEDARAQNDALVEKEGKLGAVVSVRKSSKGCAVIVLRDAEVMEKSVAQRVAVVDGVCVEIRRHTRHKKEEGAEESLPAVFVAWGHRVEDRVRVRASSLAAYFGAVAEMPFPEGLEPRAPFEEGLLRFPLVAPRGLGGDALEGGTPRADPAAPERLLDGPCCGRALVEALWEAKGRLDDHWARPPPPMARSILIRVARADLFPHSGEGGKEHENRAGDKLAELVAVDGFLDHVPPGSRFLDLCGGPGAWSQLLLGRKDLRLRGFGLTLRSSTGPAGDWQAQEKDQWYGDLAGRPDWRALWGADGSGDLLKPGNLEHCVAELRAEGGVFLCCADGGFSDKAIPPNLLELYFYRLFLAELLTAASCLQPGGRFVCKLYTALSEAMGALLFLTTKLFDTVSVVKPMSSRVTGPERYLVACGFRLGPEPQAVRAVLERSHALAGSTGPLALPLLTPVVSATTFMGCEPFASQLRAMACTLCERQAKALNAIVDRADLLEAHATTMFPDAELLAPAPADVDVYSPVKRAVDGSPARRGPRLPARRAGGNRRAATSPARTPSPKKSSKGGQVWGGPTRGNRPVARPFVQRRSFQ